jgi:Protein of unknown function, DUF488
VFPLEFRRSDGTDGRRRMREVLDAGSGPVLKQLIEEAADGPIAVFCVERGAHQCHRQVITDMAQEMDRPSKSSRL